MERKIKDYLKERDRAGLLRGLTTVSLKNDSLIRVGGRDFINFSSNDYLGLSTHPDIINAAAGSAGPVFGSCASRLMTGSTEFHTRLEEKTAAFKKKPAALVFNSGYQANVGIISALCGRDDVIFSDKLNHASIVDGISLSGARFFRFRHNDAAHLKELLSKERGKHRRSLVITETVFSMDGDIAPVEEIAGLKRKHDSLLMADEAHATGVFGESGGGILEEKGVTDLCDIVMGTFSKALGSFGAYVATSENMKEYLVNTCRSFIYSTALPVSVISANIAALDVVEKEAHRRETLLSNALYFRDSLRKKGFEVKGESQIVSMIIGKDQETVRMSEQLKERGYWVTPVRPPTVPKGTSRLRISVTYNHTRDLLDRLVEDISDICK